jgi:hypothetical protein
MTAGAFVVIHPWVGALASFPQDGGAARSQSVASNDREQVHATPFSAAIADMEKDGRRLDLDALAADMAAYAKVGFGRYLGHVRPANTLVEASSLIGNYAVEIEAEAVVE